MGKQQWWKVNKLDPSDDLDRELPPKMLAAVDHLEAKLDDKLQTTVSEEQYGP